MQGWESHWAWRSWLWRWKGAMCQRLPAAPQTGKGEESDSPYSLQKEHLILTQWNLHQISNLQNYMVINLCYFKPLNWQWSVTAATESQCTSPVFLVCCHITSALPVGADAPPAPPAPFDHRHSTSTLIPSSKAVTWLEHLSLHQNWEWQ